MVRKDIETIWMLLRMVICFEDCDCGESVGKEVPSQPPAGAGTEDICQQSDSLTTRRVDKALK